MKQVLKEYIQFLVKEALDEGKFEDAVKAYPKKAPYLKKYFRGVPPKYLPWIIKRLPNLNVYFDGTEPKELADLIKDFDKFQHRLEIKDINQYATKAALEKAVEKAKEPSETELRKVAKTGAKKLFEDETYLIVQPLNAEASMYYGKGTKWCISAKTNNVWNQYRGHKFFFIINKKTNDKDAIEYADKASWSIYSIVDKEFESGVKYIRKKYPEYIVEILRNTLQLKYYYNGEYRSL